MIVVETDDNVGHSFRHRPYRISFGKYLYGRLVSIRGLQRDLLSRRIRFAELIVKDRFHETKVVLKIIGYLALVIIYIGTIYFANLFPET